MFQPSGQLTARLSLLFTAAALLLVCHHAADAQSGMNQSGSGGNHTIQGRIYYPSGRRLDTTAKVKLQNPDLGDLSVFADRNGSFSFVNLKPGTYTIVVEAGEDYETATESVYIEQITNLALRGIDTPRVVTVPIYLQLKRNKAENSGKPGVIDTALASVPEDARKLYESAIESAQAGNAKKAVEQLKGALAIYPQFALALNELGVQYLKLGQTDNAIESLRAALSINADAVTPRLNYGIALLEKKNFTESEEQLRQVLKKNDSIATAHLYLGINMVRLRQYNDAEKELQRAVALGRDSMSLAHYYLGGIYWMKKEYKLAADELETYLKLAPKAQDADRIRATIKEMRSKQSG